MPNPLYDKKITNRPGPGASKRPSPGYGSGSTPSGKNKSTGFPKNGARAPKQDGGHIGRFNL